MDFFQIAGKLDRRLQITAGMRAHKIGNNELIPVELLILLLEFIHKFQIQLFSRLPHFIQHCRIDMLRSDLQLTADMMLYKLIEELIIFIIHQVIIADTGTDKHLFHSWQCAHCPKNFQIAAVIHLQICTALGKQTLPILTRAVFPLLIAGFS